jgi:hypothetical protein
LIAKIPDIDQNNYAISHTSWIHARFTLRFIFDLPRIEAAYCVSQLGLNPERPNGNAEAEARLRTPYATYFNLWEKLNLQRNLLPGAPAITPFPE